MRSMVILRMENATLTGGDQLLIGLTSPSPDRGTQCCDAFKMQVS